MSKITRECDILMGISVVIFIVMRIVVIITFNAVATETGAELEAIHTAYEANPLFEAFLNLGHINYAIQFLLIPALLLTVYFTLRRRVLHNKYPIDTLRFHTLFLFFFLCMNLINDAASMVGRLI